MMKRATAGDLAVCTCRIVAWDSGSFQTCQPPLCSAHSHPLALPGAGWSLFYDDNDQPLPQPLAGAALQAKQRELQQKAAAEGKVKQEGKAVAAAPVASSPGAVAGGKRAAGKCLYRRALALPLFRTMGLTFKRS